MSRERPAPGPGRLRDIFSLYVLAIGAGFLALAWVRPGGLTLALCLVMTLPVLAVLALRFFDPPTTSYILRVRARLRRQDPDAVPRRTWVPMSRISRPMCMAVLAGEDLGFAFHSGFDWTSLRYSLEFNRSHRAVRGGSTITQQLAKNLFLWPARTYPRKLIEAYITILIEGTWSKRRILEVYLNIAQFGPAVFGVGAAAEQYFATSPADLTEKQSALLAAVLPCPEEFRVLYPSATVRVRQVRIMAMMKKLNPAYLGLLCREDSRTRRLLRALGRSILAPIRSCSRRVSSVRHGGGYGLYRPRWWPRQLGWALGPGGPHDGKQLTMFTGKERYEFRPVSWGRYRGHTHAGHLVADVTRITDGLARLGLPTESAPILAAISSVEGGFDALQTFDRSKLSWGFLQFSATGTLPALLRRIADGFPELFARYFGDGGIVLEQGRIAITSRKGPRRGRAALDRLHDDPTLWKCFVLAAREPAVQDLQIQVGFENYYVGVLNQTLQRGGKQLILGELLENHEIGRALLVDSAVHSGVLQAARHFQRALNACPSPGLLEPGALVEAARILDPVRADRWNQVLRALAEAHASVTEVGELS